MKGYIAILIVLYLACNADLQAAQSPADSNAVFVPSVKVTANDGGSGQYLGNAVAIAGDTTVVANQVANGQGSIYVYVRDGGAWVQQAKLTADDIATGDDFGYSVAISGNYIVVGAPSARPNNDPSRGAAYVFFRTGTTWAQQAKLVASDGTSNDFFGGSVAIARDGYVLVGAPNHSVGTNFRQGAAYIYSRNGTAWSEQEITRADGAAGDRFGWSVAMSGFDAVVSSPFRDVNAVTDQGQAYVYELFGTVWTGIATITAPDGVAGNLFGESLAMSGLTLGSVTIASVSRFAAKVYLFQRSGSSFPFQAAISSPGDGVSNAIALNGNSLFIGLSGGVHGGLTSGKVLVYNRVDTQWSQFPELFPFDAVSGENFGTAVASSGDYTVVTAPWSNIGTHIGQGAAYFFRTYKNTPFDFDGDAKTDISIFRPGPGEWWYLKSSTGGNAALQFGASTDRMAPADFTGDGKTDIAFFRPSTGAWYVLRSEDSSFYSFPFGANGDIPVPADFDGDGKADAAVFRPSTATWYISNSGGGTTITTFGTAGDVPVAADYDGDGKADIAIYRPSSGQWWINRSGSTTVAYTFGTSTDKCVPGDYTGDGKADVAFWRPSTGEWFVLRSEDNSFYSFPFGTSTDLTSPGDYDGDGKMDAGVFRPSNSTWYINRSTAGVLIQTFGTTGDQPVPNAYVR